MNEIEQYRKRSRRYLKSARLLLEDGDYASSISRSYYAMFYLAEAVLLTRNLSYSKHQGVISAFGEHFVKTGLFSKKFSKALTQAFEKRQLSEYEAGSFLSKEETEEILKKAEEFFETVSKYLGSKASG